MMNQFGFKYEQEMGLQQGRRLLQSAIEIYNTKGSAAGLKTFVAAFSGYNATLGAVKNLVLNINDSSFEQSVGSWNSVSNVTVSRITGASESPAVVPYLESTSPANYPNGTSGILKAVITAAAGASFACGKTAPVTKGIPVTAGGVYTVSLYTRAKTAARSVSVYIEWYNRLGILLSSSIMGLATNSTSAWSRTTLANSTAPANAYFAVPVISIASGGAGEIHYFDAIQFETGSSATDYIDARRIDIKLGANRINLAKNPSFESVTTNWAATGATLATDVSAPTEVPGSSKSLKVTATGASAVVSQSNSLVAVTAGVPYTLSGYAKSANTDSITPSILYYNSGGTLLSTFTGTATTLSSSWTRVSISGTAPATAVSAKLVFTYATANTRLNYLDAVMFESASYVQTYFDGSTGYYETGDLLWEDGSAVNGRSLYYRNRVNVTTRLATVLPDYIPYGAQWALFAGVS
jgi:hypothetical protein